MKKRHFPIFLLLTLSFQSMAQHEMIKLNSGWKAKKAVEIVADGTVISGKDFKFYDWMDAVVPGTVLTTLLHNQKVPDPFFFYKIGHRSSHQTGLANSCCNRKANRWESPFKFLEQWTSIFYKRFFY